MMGWLLNVDRSPWSVAWSATRDPEGRGETAALIAATDTMTED